MKKSQIWWRDGHAASTDSQEVTSTVGGRSSQRTLALASCLVFWNLPAGTCLGHSDSSGASLEGKSIWTIDL